MKIAFFLDIPSGLGGAGNLLLRQAALMSEIHDVVVVIPADEDEIYNMEYAKRCDQCQIPYVHLLYNTSYNFSQADYVAAMDSVADIEKIVNIFKCV